MKMITEHAICVVSCLVFSSAAVGEIRYAQVNGAITGDCDDDWANACELSRAIDKAVPNLEDPELSDQVWVKAGTYAGPVELKSNIKIIGGFAGGETSASQSDPATNQTIIDGGGGNRCVTGNGEGPHSMLRGFIIRNGNVGTYENVGGGMLLDTSSVMIVQCVFETNEAEFFGGALAIRGGGSPNFINCEFRHNGTGDDGAAQPYGGGAVYVESGTPKFTNCLFYENTAGEGGAVLIRAGGPVTFTNCTFAHNRAEFGNGGAFFDEGGRASIQNSILWGNTAERRGAQIHNATGYSSTVSYSDIQGGFSGTANINADPKFENPIGDNYKIQQSSPCKNTGQKQALPSDEADLDWDGNTTEKVPKDLYLNRRLTELKVDMGAHETPRDSS